MAKFCSNCGKEIDEKADICLNCGVLVNKESSKKVTTNNINNSKKKGLPTWAIVLIIVGFVIVLPLILFAFLFIFIFKSVKSVSDESIKYIEDAKDYINDYMEDYEVVSEGTIGDTLEVDGVKFTLNSALKYSSIGVTNTPEEGNEYLVFFFDVKNEAPVKKLVTYLNFSGIVDDERVMPKLIFNEINGVNNLNKTLGVGETTSGYVVFEIEKDWENFDLTYKKLIENEGITFYVVNEDDNNSEI